jgi:putative transposase
VAFLSLSVGDEFELYSVKHNVFSIEPPNITIQRLEGNTGIKTMNYMELISEPTFTPLTVLRKKIAKQVNEEEKKFNSILEILSDAKRELVSKRFELIKPILLLDKAKMGDIKSVALFIDIIVTL